MKKSFELGKIFLVMSYDFTVKKEILVRQQYIHT